MKRAFELTRDIPMGPDSRVALATTRVAAKHMHLNQGQRTAGLVSVIIPVRDGEATIAHCLEAAFASDYANFEVIVVDDGSRDRTAEIARTYPCTLVQLHRPSGVSRARNVGAIHSKGEILFFTDADCLLCKNAIAQAVDTLTSAGRNVILGGTYSMEPADDRFFSAFQAVFVNYVESRVSNNPDYVAAHAMVMYGETFAESGGFDENFLPLIEDVDFSHRLRRTGHRLVMNPEIQVRHFFDFSFLGSVCNGFRKSKYWVVYSIHNRDLLADSGSASWALKFDAVALFGSIFAVLLVLISGNAWYAAVIPVLMAANIAMNRKLLQEFYRARGVMFAVGASVYYLLIYPLAVGAGGLAGIMIYRHFTGLLEGSR